VLSSFAFNFSLHRYITGWNTTLVTDMRFMFDGRAVQVDPIKLKMKPSRTKRLKLRWLHTAFSVCFQIQLAPLHDGAVAFNGVGLVNWDTGSVQSMVGWCKFEVYVVCAKT
jgi:hypothetical protein